MAREKAEGTARSRRRLGAGAVVVAVVGAFAVTVGIGVLRTAGAPAESVPVRVEASATATPGTVYVHVSGAVRTPGLYAVRADGRVMDAIAQAGGFTAEADRDAVNLARPVSDGEQILVPIPGAAPPPTVGGGGAAAGKLNLNTADEKALDELPRIGPALAARIIRWRTENGRFTSVDDLLAVPGIGPAVLEGLRDLVTV